MSEGKEATNPPSSDAIAGGSSFTSVTAPGSKTGQGVGKTPAFSTGGSSSTSKPSSSNEPAAKSSATPTAAAMIAKAVAADTAASAIAAIAKPPFKGSAASQSISSKLVNNENGVPGTKTGSTTETIRKSNSTDGNKKSQTASASSASAKPSSKAAKGSGEKRKVKVKKEKGDKGKVKKEKRDNDKGGKEKADKDKKKEKDKVSGKEKTKKRKPSVEGKEGSAAIGPDTAAADGSSEPKKKKVKKKKDKLLSKTKPTSSSTTAPAPSGTNPARRLPTASARVEKKKKEKSATSSSNKDGISKKEPKHDEEVATSLSKSASAFDNYNNNDTDDDMMEPITSSSAPAPPPPGYSAQQAAVNDMMRRALEEDQYSALGSVVDTDSSDDEDASPSMYLMRMGGGGSHGSGGCRSKRVAGSGGVMEPKAWNGATKLDRNSIMAAMRKHVRIEGMKTAINVDGGTFLEDAEEYLEHVHGGVDSARRCRSLSPPPSMGDDGNADGGGKGGKRKKKKKGKKGGHHRTQDHVQSGSDAAMSGSGEDDYYGDGTDRNSGAGGDILDPSGADDDVHGEHHNSAEPEDESSIFGQTVGASNATWVECDRCKKWRRLRGVVDARKLPSRWYCSMNINDPERAKCSAPEEEYDTATTPESAIDQRTRKHLRLWVRRLICNDNYEKNQKNKKYRARGEICSKDEPYEWIRCCNPSCGKWRMLLRSMDASSVIEQCKNGEWYCVMNTWDEKTASCGAAQENLPAIGCPPWVMVDDE